MRFTIEKLRTLILISGVLLVGALVVFIGRGRLRNPFNFGELPLRLPKDITADATGFTLDHAFGGHSRYRIHASKAIQYKDNHAILHDVLIELYGEDGSRVDRIEGAEFDYDKQSAKATASGPVSITLMRPGVAPAIAPNASTQKMPKPERGKPAPIASAAQTAGRGEIHVKTSGLTFDTSSGVAITDQHVDFSMAQGSGSSMGAAFDSKQGVLVLDKAVELRTRRGNGIVEIHAQHAQFERDSHLCLMHQAAAGYRGGEAKAGDAKVLFRDDGSAVRLDAINGFDMVTATGGHIAAPQGFMDFDERNQPRHGHMDGGVKMDSTRQTQDGAGQRRMRGSAPSAELEFTQKGQLRHVHLERGVEMESQSVTQAANGNQSANGELRLNRSWKSPVADVDFRDNGHGQVEPATIHGAQGVVVTGESQRGNAPAVPSRLSADQVTGRFGPNSALISMVGAGNASMDETTSAGTRQTVAGDVLQALFAQAAQAVAKGTAKVSPATADTQGSAQIQSAVVDGHVTLTQQPVAKVGDLPPAKLIAWAGHAAYDGVGELLHLTENPRVEDGGMQMSADKIDVARASGDAFAHGNVKATWLSGDSTKPDQSGSSFSGAKPSVPASGSPGLVGPGLGGPGLGGPGLGDKEPSHAIAAEAQLHQNTGEATFRGHVRLWQGPNSVAGPLIVLDRRKQILTAHSADPGEPVQAILLSTGGLQPKSSGTGVAAAGSASVPFPDGGKKRTPSVIRVRGGDLKYSDAEHKAVMRAGALSAVVAETATATSNSNQVELILLPPGNHGGKDGGQAQVDRMTAQGHVVVSSGDRQGFGEQLVYTGETGEYVLTGTAADPPRMTDPARGLVTGAALIFRSRDDSVSIEGGGRRTTTETRTPK